MFIAGAVQVVLCPLLPLHFKRQRESVKLLRLEEDMTSSSEMVTS